MPLNKYNFVIKRNDTLPALIANVIDKGELYQKLPLDLSNVTAVTFSMMNQDCDYIKIASKTTQITCASGGTIQYNWDADDTNESGNYLGEFELFFNDGKKMSLPPIGGIKILITDDIAAF